VTFAALAVDQLDEVVDAPAPRLNPRVVESLVVEQLFDQVFQLFDACPIRRTYVSEDVTPLLG
jgi:hypothetical protein